jgi:hypothetical protein
MQSKLHSASNNSTGDKTEHHDRHKHKACLVSAALPAKTSLTTEATAGAVTGNKKKQYGRLRHCRS